MSKKLNSFARYVKKNFGRVKEELEDGQGMQLPASIVMKALAGEYRLKHNIEAPAKKSKKRSGKRSAKKSARKSAKRSGKRSAKKSPKRSGKKCTKAFNRHCAEVKEGSVCHENKNRRSCRVE